MTSTIQATRAPGPNGSGGTGILRRLGLDQLGGGGRAAIRARQPNTTAGVDEFWFCGSSVIVWRAAGVGFASSTKRGCDRDRAALPRSDARGAGAPREP